MKNNHIDEEINQLVIQTIKDEQPQTVQQLINKIKEKHQLPEQKILEAVIKLQAEGKISLQKQQAKTITDFKTYIKTENTLWYWLTIGIAILTAVIVFTIPENLFPFIYIRYILGATIVLWLPGYTFIRALFPKQTTAKQEKNLDTIERIALSIGMSLAIVPIIGLLLNYTPWGIRLEPIILSLLATTTIFATAALLREYKNK